MDLPPAPWELSGDFSDKPGVQNLVQSLSTQRKSRELGLQLRKGLRDASAEFSYLRKQGIQHLTELLETIIQSEELTGMFSESQLYPELQIVPVIFINSLVSAKPMMFSGGNPVTGDISQEVRQESDDDEIVSALHLLEGCCVMDSSSRSLAARHKAAKELMEKIDSSGAKPQVQISALDALLPCLLDCTPSLELFGSIDGLARICHIIKTRTYGVNVRLKCAEFVTLLADHQLHTTSQSTIARDDILSELGKHLGATALALLKSGASQPGQLPSAGALVTRCQHILDSI